MFYIAFGIYMVGALAYLILGSGELQPWAADDARQMHDVVHLDEKDGHEEKMIDFYFLI